MIARMDAELLEHARTVDPTVLGRRVREARLARQLTQTAVAGKEMSTAYVSRIEAGQRRPDPELIAVLAERLGIPLDQLVMGTSRDVVAEQRLALDWAELSLRTGDAEAALRQVDDVLAQDPSSEIRTAALRVKAGALESTDNLDEAIIVLEDLTATLPHDVLWLVTVTELSRNYRISGDLTRAISTGEEALAHLQGEGLDQTSEATKLLMTVAAAYFERGDVGHASRLCSRAVSKAEATASNDAKVAAYWNASVMESRRGRSNSAIKLARKALAILELGEDHRQLSRLRTQLGIMQLRSETPDLEGALRHLQMGESEMLHNEVSASELGSNRVAQARARLQLGGVDEAEGTLQMVLATVDQLSPLIAADAQVLLGQIAAVRDDHAHATTMYRRAVFTLSSVGADRSAAQLWFELGTLLEDADDHAGALDAFRRAGASTGLTTINTSAVRIQTAQV